MRLRQLGGVLVVAAALVGCSKEAGQSASTVPMATAAQQLQAYGQEAWLRDRLPADAIAYVRLPNPWRGMMGPAGKPTDRMYESQAWVEAISKIQSNLAKDAVTGEAKVPMAGLLYRLGSPVEIAVVAAGRMASPAANVYVTAQLNYSDAAALAVPLAEMTGKPVTFDADGYAQLGGDGAPQFLHFDAAEKRLSLLGGMYANLESLKAVRKSIADGKVGSRPELALEREIDAHGQGLVIWADIEALRPILGAAVPPDDVVAAPLLAATKRVAIGWGAINGHGRASVRAEISGAAWSRYLPQSARKLDLKASGNIPVAFAMAWPTAEDWQRIRAGMEAADSEVAKNLAESEATLTEKTGLALADWFKPFGPDAVAFSDDAGEFFALRVADADAFKRLREALTSKMGAVYHERSVAGGTVHQLRLPSMPELARKLGEPMPGDDNEIVQLYGRMGSNLYWLEQDGWLLVSGVPQPLMDRLTLGADQSIAALLERAGTDGNALITMATSTRDVPRQAYHVWLSLLETLGDLAQADLDLTQLPTATQLGLPRDTAMSVVLDASATRLNLELNYSTHPLEWLSGTDAVTTVAVMGVLAAVAIPAYQDYELRAEVANTLMLAAPLKTAIAEYVAAKGELPGSAEQLGMELPLSSADEHASVDLDQGAIVIRFADSAPANLAGTYLYLLPTGADGVLSGWVCGYAASSAQDLLISMDESIPPSDIQSRYLPQTCK